MHQTPGLWVKYANVRRPYGAYSSALTAHGKPVEPTWRGSMRSMPAEEFLTELAALLRCQARPGVILEAVANLIRQRDEAVQMVLECHQPRRKAQS